jgi:ribosomal protein S18 acetylase RimI-like enzyme
MHFREMTPADLPDTFRIRTAAKENPFPMEALISAGITEASVTQMLATTHRGWVCEVDETIIGFAIGNRSDGEFWVIAVLPEHEGKGIGRHLMQLAQDWLFSAGCPKLWLVTGAPPTRAYHLYTKLGWQDVGPTEHGGRRMELAKPR